MNRQIFGKSEKERLKQTKAVLGLNEDEVKSFLTDVIKDLCHVHFYEADTKLRGITMGLIERPIQEMRDNREV